MYIVVVVYEPAIARCMMKYFIRDRLPLFDVTIDRKIAKLPVTIATNRTIRNIICSFYTVKQQLYVDNSETTTSAVEVIH